MRHTIVRDRVQLGMYMVRGVPCKRKGLIFSVPAWEADLEHRTVHDLQDRLRAIMNSTLQI